MTNNQTKGQAMTKEEWDLLLHRARRAVGPWVPCPRNKSSGNALRYSMLDAMCAEGSPEACDYIDEAAAEVWPDNDGKRPWGAGVYHKMEWHQLGPAKTREEAMALCDARLLELGYDLVTGDVPS